MKKFALALAIVAGVMMVAAMPALAAKPVPPPAPPAPALTPGGLTTRACPVDQKVVSGQAVYSFKGKNKVTVTSYAAGGFNAFGEPTTATFTTPIEPRFDTVNITLVCAAATVAPPDADNDGVPDASDNCPTVFNTAQGDADGDGIGNVCDPVDGRDTDFDGVIGTDDYCPNEAGSMFNHGCPDADGDGVPDASDNCLTVANTNQSDMDGDGIGNACDPVDDRDADGDGVLDASDNCLGVYNPNQSDNDLDGIGNHCDSDTPRVVHVESGYLTLEDGTGFDLLCPTGYYHDTSTLVLNFPFGINWNVITRFDGDGGYRYGVRAENRVFASDLPVAISGSFEFDCTLI